MADHTIWSTASSQVSPPTSVSHTSASMPATARTATARRRAPSAPSLSAKGSRASVNQPIARPA